MATRKTVDQILDKAADILEKLGWVTEQCYDSETGGFCALGAIAKAVYPKLSNEAAADRGYVLASMADGEEIDPRHAEAVIFLSRQIARKGKSWLPENDDIVYDFNDSHPSGVDKRYSWLTGRNILAIDEKVRMRSSQQVVKRLRSAAEKYRQQKAKAG